MTTFNKLRFFMKIDNSEYLNLLDKNYPGFNSDNINSIPDIASQIEIKPKDMKFINSKGFSTFIQRLNDLKDNRNFRRMAEKIANKYNSVLEELKDVDFDHEKIAEKQANMNSKLNLLVQEFEYLISAFCGEYAGLFDLFNESEFVLFESPEISARNDSNFKCIIGYYKSKYRRTVISIDSTLINASCVCGGGI